MSEEFQEYALRCRPLDWAKRTVVELGNLGDCGGWLRDHFDEIEIALKGDPSDVVEVAKSLAESYCQKIEEQGYGLPSDFSDDGFDRDQDLKDFEEEFFQFLVDWRRRVTA